MTDPQRIVNDHLERLLREEGNPADIVEHLEKMSPRELTSLLPGLFSSPGTIGAQREALRDTVNAVLYRKLSDSLTETIRSLDASTTRLSKIGWQLTIVVGIVGVIVSVVLALPIR